MLTYSSAKIITAHSYLGELPSGYTSVITAEHGVGGTFLHRMYLTSPDRIFAIGVHAADATYSTCLLYDKGIAAVRECWFNINDTIPYRTMLERAVSEAYDTYGWHDESAMFTDDILLYESYADGMSNILPLDYYEDTYDYFDYMGISKSLLLIDKGPFIKGKLDRVSQTHAHNPILSELTCSAHRHAIPYNVDKYITGMYPLEIVRTISYVLATGIINGYYEYTGAAYYTTVDHTPVNDAAVARVRMSNAAVVFSRMLGIPLSCLSWQIMDGMVVLVKNEKTGDVVYFNAIVCLALDVTHTSPDSDFDV